VNQVVDVFAKFGLANLGNNVILHYVPASLVEPLEGDLFVVIVSMHHLS